ncbi:nucleolar and coiled-body phosphoprotein 1-like isoform X2 [Hippocampus comes]|uniref:nucleolar and coiled-body phosphoprotein 1-like isoform X2 n=1 Tax=Hippocampus comes TaxID=109280 RepID=UPI00094DFEC8|nr:PREDICTED: nucleolar and coiled-body phosphoprotein 1-like isoform X2 [Hippocampus comes]
MEAVPSEPSGMAVDLSKGFSAPPRTRNQCTPALDLAAKPEWYQARSRVDSSYGTRSYDGDSGVEPKYVNATLPPGMYRDDDPWCPAFYQTDASCEDDSDSGSDVIVLLAAAKEPLLCASFLADGVRHIVEPLSPAPSSPECCQQTLSSQSSDSSSSEEEEVEEESESSADIPPHHARPVVLLADLSIDYAGTVDSRADTLSDDSDVVEVPVTQTTPKRPIFPQNKIHEKSAAIECKRSVRIRAHLEQVPSSSPRPVRCHLARSVKKDAMGVYYESCDSDDALGYALESDDDAQQCHTASESNDSHQRCTVNQSHDDLQRLASMGKTEEAPETDNNHHHVVNKSNSSRQSRAADKSGKVRQYHSSKADDARQLHKARKNVPQHHSTQKIGNSQQRRASNKSGKAQQHHTSESDDADQRHPTNNPDNAHRCRAASKSDNSHRRRATNKSADAGRGSTQRKPSAVAKKSVKRRRRNRRAWFPPSSLFSPPEPEIKLRCTVEQKPAKKKKKTSDNFCPFVRVRWRASSQRNDVMVVNQQEQQDVPHQKQSIAPLSSGIIPKASCFRPGRLNGAGAAPPLCCLCGGQANANGLGDLHGPYLPAAGSLAKLPDCCDDDAGERWVHSDCSVWSSRVFLVRGNLYGLQEAEQLARHTICCWCHQSGAIMGCSHKGCTEYFHYACARPAGCVLNEENLSLRCSQHPLGRCQQQQHEGHTPRKSWRVGRRHVR